MFRVHGASATGTALRSRAPRHRHLRARAALALFLLAVALSAWSNAEREKLWSDKAELSYVVADGNADVSTLGFGNRLERKGEKSTFDLLARAIRAETTSVTERRAEGTLGDFELVEERERRVTAEAYRLLGRYEHKISGRFSWHGVGGWSRNRFSGVENRYTLGGGVDNIWFDREDLGFQTGYSLTFTDEEPVVENPGRDPTYFGVAVSWKVRWAIGAHTTYENHLLVDENLEDSQDLRADMTNALSVAINARLAIKLSHQVLYDHQPTFVAVPLFTNATKTDETVLVERDDMDTVFTSSVVISF